MGKVTYEWRNDPEMEGNGREVLGREAETEAKQEN